MSEQNEQVEEFRTNDKSHSRSLPFLPQSYHIESNKANDVCRDAGGKPLEGIRVTEDGIIRRFHKGLLDGDSYTPEGKGITQPAIEGPGHIEYWREGCLHRDGGLPAVSAKGFTHKEWWEKGEWVKCEDKS